MSWKLQVRDLALEDTLEAKAWYDKKSEGLGTRFLVELNDTFGRILPNPNIHGWVTSEIRFVRLHKFPYVVYFHIGEEIISILAVMHGRRDKNVILKRL